MPKSIRCLVWLVAAAAVTMPGVALRTPPTPGCFSRGIAVAELSQREAPAMLPVGEGTLLVWSDGAAGDLEPLSRLVTLSGELENVRRTRLPDGLLYSGQPQLVSAADGPWLLFFARSSQDAPRGLYAAPLLSEGDMLLGEAMRLEGRLGVRSYAAAGTGDLIWVAAEDETGGLWLFRLEVGTGGVARWRLGPGGTPALTAAGGRVCLVWSRIEGGDRYLLHYTELGEEGPSAPVVLRGFPLGTGTVPSAPALAIGGGWAYAAVGLEYRGGELAGQAEVWICAFPLARPEEGRCFSLRLPGAAPAEYPLSADDLALAPLPPQEEIRPTDLYQPRGAPPAGGYALLALGAKLYGRGGARVQPTVVALAAGTPVGWAPIALSRDFSYLATLVRSERGWHAAWLDMLGYGEYRLYYAATPDEERVTLDRVGWDDLVYFLGTAASGMVGGLALIPLFLMASVPGLVVLFFHYVLGGEESLRYRGPKVLLALSLLPYLILKIALTGMFGEVPFAQWLSQPLVSAAARVIPFVPALLGAAAVYLYFRRSGEPTLLPAWAAFVITDLLFTVIIVGPAFAGG